MPGTSHEGSRQETGGPSRCKDGGSRSAVAGSDIEARIIALEALTTPDLQIEWRRLYQATPPTRLSRDLLIRGVAYRLQEQEHGGLKVRTRRMLRSLAEGSDKGRSSAAAIVLKPGTKLVREWRGHVHRVGVLDHGFEYRGEGFRSLTQIARQITGMHWSGPLFFGINKRQRSGGGRDE